MQKPNSISEGHKAGKAATVIVAVGGTPQRYARVADADVTVMVDSVDELGRVPQRDTLIKVPVGDHETLQTLLGRMGGDPLAEALATEYCDRPNILLSKGMAQDPRIGAVVARDLMRRGELEAVARQTMTLLMVAANGALSHVEILEANSNAGGMGAGGGPEIGHYLATHIETFSRATVKYTMFRVGALTYLPVAPRAAANARMATKSNAARIAKQRTERRIQDVELAELPLRGEDGRALGAEYEQRAWLASTLLQARRAPEVADLIDSREVNHRLGEFGEFRRITACWSSSLESSALCREGAARYLRAIQELPARWSRDSRASSEQQVEVIPGDLDLPSAEAVLQELKIQSQSDGQLLTRLLTEDGGAQSSGVVLKTGETSIEMGALVRQLARGEVTEDYIGSLIAGMGRRLQETETELAAARARRETSRQALRAALAASRKKARSTWNTFMTKIESTKDAATKNTRWVRTFEPVLRSLVQEHVRVARCLEAIAVLQRAIEILEGAAISKYEVLSGALTRLAGAGTPDTGRVRYLPFSAVAQRLEKAAAQSDEALADTLMGSVASITLPGIGAMFGVPPDPAFVVTALIESKYAWIAPLWGGSSTYSEPRHRIVVLPPMQDDDFEALRREAEQRVFRPLLRRGGSAAAGCAVVALDFYAVDEYEDILPAFYESQPEIAGGEVEALRAAGAAA
jgi:hypothetical protein